MVAQEVIITKLEEKVAGPFVQSRFKGFLHGCSYQLLFRSTRHKWKFSYDDEQGSNARDVMISQGPVPAKPSSFSASY